MHARSTYTPQMREPFGSTIPRHWVIFLQIFWYPAPISNGGEVTRSVTLSERKETRLSFNQIDNLLSSIKYFKNLNRAVTAMY